jgi:digeranylgeranylglycerophospholipid reductase
MTSEPLYDAIIVGAGPAGSVAAKVTAEHGLHTLLIDRRQQVGVPVQCGEFLPTPGECRNLLPNAPRIARLCRVPKALIVNRCATMRLISPLGSAFEFPLSAVVLDRAGFDQALAAGAARAGAEIMLGTTVLRRSQDNVLLVRKNGLHSELRSKVVIGADGPRSLVAASLGQDYQDDARDMALSIQYRMDGVDCDRQVVEMYFGRTIAPGGYSWIIPRSDHAANVGLGLRRPFCRGDVRLSSYLNRFVSCFPASAAHLRNATVQQRISANIPVGGPKTKTYSENAILAGDAAGHVMASNGGGIPTALGAGELAGLATIRYIEDNTPLSWYEATWRREIGRELTSALTVLRVADSAMSSDALTDVCMRLAGAHRLSELIRCRLPLPVYFASKSLVQVLEWLL